MDWVRSIMLSVCQIKILMLSMNSLIHLYCRNMKVGDTFLFIAHTGTVIIVWCIMK